MCLLLAWENNDKERKTTVILHFLSFCVQLSTKITISFFFFLSFPPYSLNLCTPLNSSFYFKCHHADKTLIDYSSSSFMLVRWSPLGQVHWMRRDCKSHCRSPWVKLFYTPKYSRSEFKGADGAWLFHLKDINVMAVLSNQWSFKFVMVPERVFKLSCQLYNPGLQSY